MHIISYISDSIQNCVLFMKESYIDLGFAKPLSLFHLFVCLTLSSLFTTAFSTIFNTSVNDLHETDIYG